MSGPRSKKLVDTRIRDLNVLVVDDSAYMRKITRAMLVGLGVKSVTEASNGLNAIEMIRVCDPDIMLLEWEMPVLNGMEVMKIVRAPRVFARPNLPTIMLTDRPGREYVNEAMRAGVHEFLLKPTSPKALRDRLVSIVMNPRPMIKIGSYYVPQPRAICRSI